MNKIKYIAAVLIAIAGLGFQQAKADSVTYTLGTGNDPALGSGPFGTVQVSLDSTGFIATVTFTAASGYLFVDGGAVAVNVNGPYTVSAYTVTPVTANPVTSDGSGQEDGFGTFNQVGSQANSSKGASTVTFTLTNTSGTPWAGAGQVLTANNDGWLVAAHIQIATGPSQGVTGFAAGPTQVPDGGTTVMLLGAALGGLGLMRRFVKR
jgi:VPDSG-CTERM motif